MSMSPHTNETAGGYSRWLIMELGSRLNMQSESLDSLSACTAATITREAALDWRFANAWWSSTAAGFGWSSLLPDKDPPSASPFPHVPDSDPQSRTASADPPRTVLLVEDNPTDIFVIKEAIERSGLSVNLHLARDGQEALLYLNDLARNEKPSCPELVLLDLNLPKVGGIEVLRHLRNSSPCSRTPVIVVTSSTAEVDRAAVRNLGAEAYFLKPTTLSAYMELGQVVARFLRRPEKGGES